LINSCLRRYLFSGIFYFYIVQIIRRSSKMFKGIEQMITNINEVIKTTKEKIEHSAAYVSIIADGLKKVMEIAKQEGKKARNKKEMNLEKKQDGISDRRQGT